MKTDFSYFKTLPGILKLILLVTSIVALGVSAAGYKDAGYIELARKIGASGGSAAGLCVDLKRNPCPDIFYASWAVLITIFTTIGSIRSLVVSMFKKISHVVDLIDHVIGIGAFAAAATLAGLYSSQADKFDYCSLVQLQFPSGFIPCNKTSFFRQDLFITGAALCLLSALLCCANLVVIHLTREKK